MFKMPKLNSRPVAYLGVLLVLGMAAGVGLMRQADFSSVRASTAAWTEQVSVATMPLARERDRELEMVVVLDHPSGTLSGYVVDPTTRRFLVRYSYPYLSRDFGVSARGARFALVTGSSEVRPTERYQFAQGTIYVTEEHSGQVRAYGAPWRPNWRTYPRPPIHTFFIPFDAASFRPSYVSGPQQQLRQW